MIHRALSTAAAGALLLLALIPAAPAAAADLTVCPAPASEQAALQQARRLVAEIRAELAPVEDQIRNVPFVTDLEAGAVTTEQLAALLGEQYHIIRSDWGSFAQMVTRFDDPASRSMFGGIAGGEAIALDLLLRFAAVLGVSEQELADYQPRPAGQTYPSRVAWIATHADRASAGASFLVNFAVFGENMGRVQRALVDVYGYTAELTVGDTAHAIRPGRVSLIPPGVRVEYRYRGRSEHLYAHFAAPAAGPPAKPQGPARKVGAPTIKPGVAGAEVPLVEEPVQVAAGHFFEGEAELALVIGKRAVNVPAARSRPVTTKTSRSASHATPVGRLTPNSWVRIDLTKRAGATLPASPVPDAEPAAPAPVQAPGQVVATAIGYCSPPAW